MEQRKVVYEYDVDVIGCWRKVQVNQALHRAYLVFDMNDAHDCVYDFVYLEKVSLHTKESLVKHIPLYFLSHTHTQ